MSEISIGPLRIKILGRANPLADDYWDGNWLNAKAFFSDKLNELNASASGSIIHLSELKSFSREMSLLERARSGKAILKCMEPNLYVELEILEASSVRAVAKVSPEPMTEATNECVFKLDPSDLKPILASLNEVLTAYPLKALSECP